MKKVKAIILGATLALVLTALLGAGAASAAQFRADQYPMTFSGTTPAEVKIQVNKGIINCTKTTLAGAESEASADVTLTPSFAGCKAFGYQATFKANSCGYVFHSTNNTAPFTGSVDIACGKAGDKFEVTNIGNNCLVSIPVQSGLGTVTFANAGTNRSRAITATLSLTGLQYSESGTSCFASGSYSNGTVKGSYLLSGVNEQQQHGVYLGTSQVDDLARFQAEGYPALLQGSQEVAATITTNTGPQSCTTLRMNGQVSSGTADLRLHPELEGCKWLGFTNTASTAGCDFVAYTTTSAISTGALSIVCNPGSEIVIQGNPAGINCQIRIPAQSGLGSATFENVGSGTARKVRVKINIKEGLTYTEAGPMCSSPGTHANGSFEGTVLETGFQSVGGTYGAQQGFWVA